MTSGIAALTSLTAKRAVILPTMPEPSQLLASLTASRLGSLTG